jgi:hypothetical protein
MQVARTLLCALLDAVSQAAVEARFDEVRTYEAESQTTTWWPTLGSGAAWPCFPSGRAERQTATS